MSTPTEAHRKLVDEIVFLVAHDDHKGEAAQLLADSEARAVEAETALLRQLYASEKQAKVERGDMFCECQDALAALRERVRVLEEANTWQDKSNAPIERTRVLATYLGVYEPCVGSISDSRFYPDGQSGSEPFTHWMPLPTLAATAEHAKEGSV